MFVEQTTPISGQFQTDVDNVAPGQAPLTDSMGRLERLMDRVLLLRRKMASESKQVQAQEAQLIAAALAEVHARQVDAAGKRRDSKVTASWGAMFAGVTQMLGSVAEIGTGVKGLGEGLGGAGGFAKSFWDRKASGEEFAADQRSADADYLKANTEAMGKAISDLDEQAKNERRDAMDFEEKVLDSLERAVEACLNYSAR